MIESPVRDFTNDTATESRRTVSRGGDVIYLGDIFHLLSQRWRIVAKFAAVFLAVAAVLAFILPVEYTSQASFIPPAASGASSMAAALAGQLASIGGSDLLGSAKTTGDVYAGILRSKSVTSEIVQRLNLMRTYGVAKESQAEKKLASATSITADPKSTIVTISVTAKSPQLAHDIADGYLRAVRNTDGRLAITDASQRRLFYSQQLAKEKDDLENAEVELKKVQEQSGLIAPAGQTAAEIKTIADTQAEMAMREVQLAALRQSSTEQNAEVIRLKSEIESLRAQLTHLQHGGGSGSELNVPTTKVPDIALQYVRAEREVKYHETLFEMLARQYETARLEEAREGPMLQILDSASLPDTKSAPARMLIMLLGLLLGILFGAAKVLLPYLRQSS